MNPLRALILMSVPGLLWTTPAAAEGILATTHNLIALADQSGNSAKACMFCHPRQGPDGPVKTPLWNRHIASPAFTVHGVPSPRATAEVRGGSAGTAAVCLSCHDGVIAPDVLAKRPGSPGVSEGSRDSHPVGMLYAAAGGSNSGGRRAARLVPAIGGVVNGELPLYDGYVQCATCHDPHMRDAASLLRKSNAGSALCMTCHLMNVNY